MGKKTSRDDYRTQAARAAEARVLSLCDAGTILGLGGGPSQAHPRILNLNIAAYDNVNIVGDAHGLPLRTSCLDGVHCEAVFEHLDDPNRAAAELFRVMKPGAIAYVCTPFMQAFHGHPSHFQNFTHHRAEYGHQASARLTLIQPPPIWLPAFPQRLVPVVITNFLDGTDPGHVEGRLGHLQVAHRLGPL